ncbi:uncharacterized protein PGTG_02240 [Puccinia graminis f. sp. tritici CRL 75-36-700-3]|uniref:DNA 3'-5' helicase n=1 Tax=Puccinia graminis f. sp. tritici (strain CRL 75-36-700-3 / race SCCL) TaxID=418459 RepID=E3JXK4_PUCGT|nr:uncharacterized protein PGTG_02240 [Puccinia graminis f. sp. tritici CRL 75-36-700-3]EFP76779.1 hypothetical protein PGTG_02240 [Puccinia graminis f. sp. tritici CRL 75-36-700-3]
MTRKQKKSTKVTLTNDWLEMNDEQLREAIIEDARPCYPETQPSKPLQVDAVMGLVKKRNTFVMAGTGFRKSRISEMHLHLFPAATKPVVLVLNPLDALGDNQVEEKITQKYTAINLKKLTFNAKVAARIKKGEFNFVYLSPEIFLNNQMFVELFHDSEFQNHLVSIVVDEAHMIYGWGMVASGKAKKSSAHKQHGDRSIFRPSYGEICRQLMATQGIPVLLLSATCRPQALEAIQKNLKLTDDNIDIVRAELTRPEIRILQFPMRLSLKSVKDLTEMFGKEEDIPNNEVVPTLIYSSTQNATLKVMKAVNLARGTPGGEYNPNSKVIRRYHACTGDLEKKDVIDGYESADFSCISCTMALGLGQNWKRVRRVIQIGRGDPSCICQMIGRCGRDGRPGLAILFVEPKRRFGLNTLEAISKADKTTDDVQMDSLSITPVCLRIAFAVDNKHGHIPMNYDDPKYLKEKDHEETKGFPICKCSNCFPEEANLLRANMLGIKVTNFEEALDDPKKLTGGQLTAEISPLKKKKVDQPTKSKEFLLILDHLAVILVKRFDEFFYEVYGKARSFSPHTLFSLVEANVIAQRFEDIKSTMDIEELIGGEVMDGQLDVLHECLSKFKEQDIEYKTYVRKQNEYQETLQNEMD